MCYVGPGSRGDGSGHQVQRTGARVTSVAGAWSMRRPGGLDLRRDLGRCTGQQVGKGRAGRMGRRGEVLVGCRRAGVGAGMIRGGGAQLLVGSRRLVPWLG